MKEQVISQNSNYSDFLSDSHASPTRRDSIAEGHAYESPQNRLPHHTSAPNTPQPIAIIGIGCRFPGSANSPQAFWELLRDGVDAITEVPPDRFSLRQFYDPDPNKAGKVSSRWGGFIENIDQFEPQFFGISPREASRIDPQQRLLLEVSWEALEDSGLVPATVGREAGSRTGVFIGLSSHDYADIQSRISERDAIDAYMGTGSAMSIAANRISYCFDFTGPSVAIDTACSSALVAIHLACQSIRNGECTLALAGGVNAILKPEVTISFSKASMLSRNGRCKSFDAQADGFVRAEGAGVVILKPLDQAQADGDPIYAVIIGSAINQDGHTTGITVPNGGAQELMLREAYRQAGVAPELVQYVEAHGTGTALGDPIEARALGAVLGANRSLGDLCLIGSVKSNIGHLEAGAGIAGIIKVALALKHGQIPPTLHFQEPNPKIPFDDLRLRVVDRLLPWPANNQMPRLAGVNSFGFGGTNAHVVLQEAPSARGRGGEGARGREGAGALLLPLSARSREARRAMAQAYLDLLTSPFSPAVRGAQSLLSDICYSAAVHRAHHDHRLALVGQSKAEMVQHLEAFLAGESHWGIAAGHVLPRHAGVSPHESKLVFVFSGMGPQWWGMGRELLADAVFREMIERCDRLLQPLAGWSLWDALTASEAASRINETQIAQPAIFALQVALAALWRSWGIEPAAVVGHSIGEIAASYMAGILSLEDAIQVIYHRSRLQAKLAGQGTMLAVGLSAPDVERYIKRPGYQARVSIAAINSPRGVTLAGEREALAEIASALGDQEIFCRFLRVEVPYHSPLMERITDELVASLQSIKPQPATIPFYSTVTGKRLAGPELGAAHWGLNVRQPVYFATAISEMGTSHDLFLEISAHPVLASSILQSLAEAGREGHVLPSLRRPPPASPPRPLPTPTPSPPAPSQTGRARMLASFGKLYTLGYPVDWQCLYPRGQFVRLPSYPWQREHYWHESQASRLDRVADLPFRRGDILGQQGHPLLGSRLKSPHPLWDGQIDKLVLTYLDDHRLQGTVVYPAAAYVEMALAAAKALGGDKAVVIQNLNFEKALFLPHGASPTLQFIYQPQQGTKPATFEIYSRQAGEEAKGWVRHATGELHNSQSPRRNPQSAIPNPQSFPDVLEGERCYGQFLQLGFEYGPSFQGIERLYCGQGEALGKLRLVVDEAQLAQYELHPTILDACFQVLLGALPGMSQARAGQLYLPVQIAHLHFRPQSSPAVPLWAYASLAEQAATYITGEIYLLDGAGNLLVEVKGLRCEALGRQLIEAGLDQYLYQYQWELQPTSSPHPADYMPDDEQLKGSLLLEAGQLSQQLRRERYYGEVEQEVDHLCTGYLVHALEQLGCPLRVGQTLMLPSLRADLGVMPEYERLLGRMLAILHEDGFLKQIGDGYQVSRLPKLPDSDSSWRLLLLQYPAYQAELILIRRCGLELASVLRGETDPLQLIFPQGEQTLAEQLYRDSPSFRIYNLLAQKAVTEVLANLPEGRMVRILEIGAGTGATSAYLLPILPAERTEYLFTDISPLFMSVAAQKFAAYPFVDYRVLDIEQPLKSQGFEPHSFDLIIAADVIHATRDLRHTLTHVKELLASEGLLLLIEGTNLPRWVDIVFGLLKGWWLFSDLDLRPSHPLLSYPKWENLLQDLGFSEVVGVADIEPIEAAKQSVILAKGPVVTRAMVEQGAVEREGLGSWLLFADRGGVAERLGQLLKERGQEVTYVWPGRAFKVRSEGHLEICPTQPLYEQLYEQPFAASLAGIVHLWSLDIPEGLSLGALEESQRLAILSVTYLLQGLDMRGLSTRLWLILRGSQPVEGRDDPISVANHPLWSFGRGIINELPHLRTTMIDLSQDTGRDEIDSLFEELWSSDDTMPLEAIENEIALRGQARYVHRLKRVKMADIGPPEAIDGLRLQIATPGVLDELTFHPFTRRQPAAGEVEIEVIASALNFKDVAKAMGILGEMTYQDTASGRALGVECAGKISAIGEGVKGFKVGDEVVGFVPHSFATYAYVDARSLVHKPAHLTHQEAATITLAFITVHYALNDLARIEAGERILIHAASGGVGLAAVQVAQQVGAEIFATAGNDVKREFLRALGVQHVYDSRSLAFADQIMEETNGQGVDVVLNSLTGEALTKSLAVLAPYGRFLELGKRDIEQNNLLGLRPFQENLSFFAIDLDRLSVQRPKLASRLLHEVMEQVNQGNWHPLPHRIFPVSEIVSAFRYMASAKHIGKVVVSMQGITEMAPKIATTSDEDEKAALTFSADATYLLTGGLGGLGLAVAQWMVEHGAAHLVLMGRSGASSPAAKEAVAALRAAGAEIKVAQADVTSESDVARVLSEIKEDMPPLRGIIHGAMVLDDGLILQLTQEGLAKVWGPKVIGAYQLHKQTISMPLDFFIMFSSFTSLVGNPGQGNYVAACGFLDALAHYRRAKGLPALTINWGAVAEVGYVAERAEVRVHLARMGVKPVPLSIALDILGKLIQREATQTAVLSGDWQQMVQQVGSSPKLSYLYDGSTKETQAASESNSLKDKILTAAPKERQQMLVAMLREQVGRVLGTSAAKVEVNQPLTNLGLDSLMALELRNRIKSDITVEIPTIKLLEGPTIGQLATFLSEELGSLSPLLDEQGMSQDVLIERSEPPEVEPDLLQEAAKQPYLKAGELLAQVDDLGDEEVDELLMALLEE